MEDKFLKVAKQAALEAGKIISKYSGKVHRKNIKFGDHSDFATEADLEAEKVIISILSKEFPEHNIVTEEQENIEKGSEYTWVVDPLDGTITFEHGIPFFSVSIGLLKNNQPYLGVIYRISTNDFFWAQKDKGAFLNDKSIKVSSGKSLEEAVVIVDLGHKQKRPPKLDLYIKPMIYNAGYIYSFGSAVLTLAFVANGMIDAGISQAWIWDFAAAAIILTEAGGKITDFEGNEPDWSKERLNILASNGLIHDQILEALK
ncbi:hypothetical protein A3B45_00755 [Candidatus Daviesbacteria bacterium RIFCSPLOWO2_01_FULL_39_12]|uniref:Inositol-1-monophosphatase n=1 Tax=Candidatus Daviesbacteria bacterium RIFCSPLOWO2_01_FULL_39_12 TaxID=1797785 RepID=A0A1F5KQP6_9BACT|nr:MAG: hypothetical protein A3D79_01935 [Candidatus Daviesbacteria bacterium RIFCSPHIGHO2_02_FULL_39_8]OGE43238.1 MAG: hypothetical protein A3B45_00755 [Candidatus Daviesbacteria bacterium RIFCSPLOWO2_01_FULL_39_12]